jgi:ATP synthase I subunit
MSTEQAIPVPASESSADSAGAQRLEWINLILVVAGGAITLGWKSWPLTWSFLAGGLLTVVNFRLLRIIVRSLTRPQGIKKGKLVAQVILKYLGGLGALAVIMFVFHPRPAPFLFGLSTIVAAVVIEGVWGIFHNEATSE